MGLLDRLLGKPEGEDGESGDALQGEEGFSLGSNIVSDPDINTVSDLRRYYPLPEGFDYAHAEGGTLHIVRKSDDTQFNFVIEEGLLTFDEAYTKNDGRTGFRTTEVFRRA